MRKALPLYVLFLTGCPDFVISGFRFTTSRTPAVTIANMGADAASEDEYIYASLHVDGKETETRYVYPSSLGRLASYEVPFGSTRLLGVGRRLLAQVDATKRVNEESEMQNTFSRELNVPTAAVADLGIYELTTLGSGALRVIIRNFGSASSVATSAWVYPVIDGSVGAALSTSIPALAAGDYYFIDLPSVVPVGSQRVSIRVAFNNIGTNQDVTNDSRQRELPTPASQAPFDALLSDARLAPYVVSISGISYAVWPTELKVQLARIIRDLSTENYALPIPNPTPEADGTFTVGVGTAQEIYLAHLAQSLWVEVNGIVPWHLVDLPVAERQRLLDGRQMFTQQGINRYSYAVNAAPSDPRAVFHFLRATQMIKATPAATTLAFAEWIRGHVSHFSFSDSATELWGTPDASRPSPLRILYPLATASRKHVTTGCWGTTAFLGEVLRTVNIAVIQRSTLLNHSGVHIPAAGLSLIHSDDLYESNLFPSGGNVALVPTQKIFVSDADYAARFASPTLECTSAGCNNLWQQRSVEHHRTRISVGLSYLANGLLLNYSNNAVYGGRDAYIFDLMYPASNTSGRPVSPTMSLAEANATVDAIEAEIARLGISEVRARQNRFLRARADF
jgi:hypothetical protein